MKKDSIDTLFKNLKDSFDLENPEEGHELRFLDKLKSQKEPVSPVRKKSYASVDQQVVSISPEISKTEFYFANVIQQEINKLQNENTPATKKIIEDTMKQLITLEKDYGKLEKDLINGGNSKFILSAMITNFQTRIDLLADVLQQIDEIKKSWNGNGVAPIITKQLEMMIKSVNGNKDLMNIRNLIETLPIKDSQSFRKFINQVKPGLDLTQNVTTPSGETIQVEIGFGVEFFRPFYGL